MIGDSRVLCVVPARAGSKGLPGKNLLKLCGDPLVAWPVKAAQASLCVDHVICSTDDPNIAAAALDAGAQVPFMRPSRLASDQAKTADVVIHALTVLADRGEEFEYVSVLEPTSPLTEGFDLDDALRALYSHRAGADAIVGLGKFSSPHPALSFYLNPDGTVQAPTEGAVNTSPRRQDLEAVYFIDGSLYVSRVTALLREKSFVHARTLGYLMPRWKNLEIDDKLDWILTEAVLSRRNELRDSS